MPRKRVELPFHREFSREELKALAFGMLPSMMEERWIGLLHEGTVDLYRSWTGMHIYRLSLQGAEHGVVAFLLTVNREQEEYSGTDDDYDIEFVEFLLGRWLRGRRA